MHLACPGLVRSLEGGDTVVVPSTLLASIAAEQFSQHQLSIGRGTWQRPSIYSVGAWLAVCWRDARFREAEVPALLSPSQEHALWLRIVEREHPELFDASRMALLASRAARLLAEWQVPTEGESWNEHPDARQFQHWHRLFRRECRARDWITRAELWRLIPEWIRNGGSATAATRFTGFDTRTPALMRVLDALGDRGAVETASSAMPANMALARPSKDFAAELEFAARRARAILEKNPQQSIGIFVAGLAANARSIERSFEQVLRPASLFHVHAGPPLADQPLVAGARLLLELAHPVIHYADASSILRSPFLPGAAAERSARSLADIALRKRRELDFSLADMEQAAVHCPTLLATCRRLRRLLPSKNEKKELPGWSRFISDWLEAAGWPGDAELTEREEKIVELWNEALSELAALGLVSPAVTFESALTHLRRLLSKSVEVGNWSSPVQVLEAAGASGLEFASGIAVGLSEENWPPREPVSPLVPFALQRAYKVPGSTPQSAQDERERRTAALFRVAPDVIATYSGRLAPLAERFVRREFVETEIWTGPSPRQLYLKASLERLEDSQGPVLLAETVKGGASLIKAQSLCPFKAFAEYRLAAQAPEEACFGFDARERGGFLHKALENVWERLGSQSVLRGTPPDDLRLVIQSAIADAIHLSETGFLHQLVSRAEQERLEKIVWDWLAVERARKQPFVVETVEQETHFEAFGLKLRLRVDRIDRLENGHVLLIDYKSGPQSRNKLKGARPKEPQLLVYAASSVDQVDGIFFAEMKANEVRAVGVSREKQFESRSIDVKKHEWNSFLEESRAEIDRLAEQFVNGYAVVDPLPQVCGYCASKPLCRIQEAGGQGEEEEC
jgi:probable DNA repair protein